MSKATFEGRYAAALPAYEHFPPVLRRLDEALMLIDNHDWKTALPGKAVTKPKYVKRFRDGALFPISNKLYSGYLGPVFRKE
ncbi:hypothetical protein DL766_001728 [Monosporascus sp. MC13-8B]|uniref:Uncharacterized protein n=1 Tax=Monosporascus cannonballus TaxID=155416 RepID=A0ABY0H5F5_9PEZI|nr:hypothetical protein DL762_005258 [Monosporascus cannonballus]RYO89046.1 hypothetical protein DL763_005800 [Monosporascus cannonballus]RYP36971.1 hypothetical protein DL766_001728 [Monosporascus sp. MC13-8B]